MCENGLANFLLQQQNLATELDNIAGQGNEEFSRNVCRTMKHRTGLRKTDFC